MTYHSKLSIFVYRICMMRWVIVWHCNGGSGAHHGFTTMLRNETMVMKTRRRTMMKVEVLGTMKGAIVDKIPNFFVRFRHYNNSFTDGLKQDSLNLFWVCFWYQHQNDTLKCSQITIFTIVESCRPSSLVAGMTTVVTSAKWWRVALQNISWISLWSIEVLLLSNTEHEGGVIVHL